MLRHVTTKLWIGAMSSIPTHSKVLVKVSIKLIRRMIRSIVVKLQIISYYWVISDQ